MGLIHKIVCDKCQKTIKEKSYMTVEPLMVNEKRKTAFPKLYLCKECYEEMFCEIKPEGEER